MEIHFDFANGEEYLRVLEVEKALRSLDLKFDTRSVVNSEEVSRGWEFDFSLEHCVHFLWDEASKQWKAIQARNGTRVKHVTTQT